MQGSIPGWGTKIPHATQHSQKLKKLKKRPGCTHWLGHAQFLYTCGEWEKQWAISQAFSDIFSSQRPRVSVPGHSFCRLSSQWEPAQLLLCCCSGWYDNIPATGKCSPPTQHCSFTRQEAPSPWGKESEGPAEMGQPRVWAISHTTLWTRRT